MNDLDSAMDVLDTLEKRNRGVEHNNDGIKSSRVFIGTVEQYFSKIGVVAIKLNETLNVGDVIEIGTDDDAVRQKIISMQIDRQDIDSATDGDSVGIKLKYKVEEGSEVYKIIR